jgi:predicted RNA-binding Zn-ribbon protein involved in translation (DUF1610 family)
MDRIDHRIIHWRMDWIDHCRDVRIGKDARRGAGMIITPMENEKLLACKECGSVRIKLKIRVAYGTFWYVCQKCGCSSQSAKSIAEAAQKWNAEMDDGETDGR